MFDELLNEIRAKKKPENKKEFNIAENPALNPSIFRHKLDEIDTISDTELYETLKYSYSSILNDIFMNHDQKSLMAFTHPKFITILTQVIASVQLTPDERICVNKLIYDYTTLMNNDERVKVLLSVLSKMINRREIQSLVGLEIPENLSAYLALCRYSDKKEDINIKRLNFVITTSNKDLMTTQMIIDIYEKLFSGVQILIETTMFDVDFYDQEIADYQTPDTEEVYSNIGLAILTILDNQPAALIYNILKSYAEDFKLQHESDPTKVRFSMHCISEDYNRISIIVEQLEQQGFIVP